MLQMTTEDWFKQGEELYGPNREEWRFICPGCKTTFARKDFPEDARAMSMHSCIGRFYGGANGGCDWTLHGFFRIHTKEIVAEHGNCIPVFRFADEPSDTKASIQVVRHSFTPVDTWTEFQSQWPEWVPQEVRGQIESFWADSCGRGPRAWLKSMEEQRAPIFGTEASDENIAGRFVFCWNNIGRIITADGKAEMTSF